MTCNAISIAVLCAAVCTFSAAFAEGSIQAGEAETAFNFKETKNGVSRLITELVKPSGDGLLISSEQYRIISDRDFNARTLSYHDGKLGIEANYKEGELSIEVTKGGTTKTSSVKPATAHWAQEQFLYLERFAMSPAQKDSFFSVRLDNAGVYDFDASKIGVETIAVDGKEVRALHVRMNLQGLMAMFWKADLWFDSATGRFLRYSAPSSAKGDIMVVESLRGEAAQ
jgi:hypothetical protein